MPIQEIDRFSSLTFLHWQHGLTTEEALHAAGERRHYIPMYNVTIEASRVHTERDDGRLRTVSPLLPDLALFRQSREFQRPFSRGKFGKCETIRRFIR